jgi:voltage-gated potassium channel
MEFLSERRIERIHNAVLSGRIIPYLAFVTGAITLLAALAVRLLARGEFTSFGESVWWAAQTVTTVGYGDVVPDTAFSKVVAVFVMFFGIATLTITTAIVTSAVVSATQRKLVDKPEGQGDPQLEALRRIEQRLEALERKLG